MGISFKQIESFVLDELKGSLKRSIQICETCKGEGTITSRKYYGHTEGYSFESKACFSCKGKGRLKLFQITWSEDF